MIARQPAMALSLPIITVLAQRTRPAFRDDPQDLVVVGAGLTLTVPIGRGDPQRTVRSGGDRTQPAVLLVEQRLRLPEYGAGPGELGGVQPGRGQAAGDQDHAADPEPG